jgi:hypothetical protein
MTLHVLKQIGRLITGGKHVPALSSEAIDRLAAHGFRTEAQLQFHRDILRREGERFFQGLLAEEEQNAEEYRCWLPRLQAFAADCRREVPIPDVETLPAIKREQHRVLLEKMRAFNTSDDRGCIFGTPNVAAILLTSLNGLAATKEVFGMSEAVVLLQSEADRWFAEVNTTPDEPLSWCSFAWWSLSEELADDAKATISRNYPIPDGSSYWLLESGLQWGPLSGGVREDLWQWDGGRAEFVARYSDIDF